MLAEVRVARVTRHAAGGMSGYAEPSAAQDKQRMAALRDSRVPVTMLLSFDNRPDYVTALDRVRAWTRERFTLAQDATIFVSEVSCLLPGCPPRETVVVFWTGTDTRHQFKLFKPVAEVARDDLPPAWMKNALVATDGFGYECC